MANIKIKNIYYMLTYAFTALRQEDYKHIELEDFEDASDMFASILTAGLKSLIKQGLNREYIDQTEQLSGLKGKINISESVKENTLKNRKLVCTFDEFSINSYMNRILLTTADLLLRSGIKKESAKALKKQLIYFDGVEMLDRKRINWDIQYNRCNKSYEMLVGICYLVIEGLLLSDKQGHVKMGKFLDDQKMHRLYEKFILEYYRFHYPQFHARAMYIDWAEESGNTDLLPKMKTDITLQHNNNTLIIDAKYYTHNVQEYNNRFIVSSNNLYQMYSYVKNYVDSNKVKKENVSGMLLYAKTEDEIQADSDYVISGNKISVKNLDLNTEFIQIRNQLNNIVATYFKK